MMRTVVSELRAVASKAPLSISTINTYLSQLDPTLKDQVSFVGWVRDGEVFRQFWYRAENCRKCDVWSDERWRSGATDFVTLASQIPGAIAEGHRCVQLDRLQRVKRAQKH
jgi:hypothetical protein